MQGILRPQCSPAATDCQPAAERQPYPKITLDIACRTNRKESLAVQGFSLVSCHHARRNHRCRTPRHPRPPDGACATGLTGIIAAFSRLTSPRPLELSHCAHAQGQSRVPMCRTVLEEYAAPAARGMQTEMPPKQAALARQVRQRMNRLGKPEHRARFCFFSKKKSRAGMRRFPIPSKIQIRTGFNCSARYDFKQAALRPFAVSRALPSACAPGRKPAKQEPLRDSSVLTCMPSKPESA